MNSVEAGRAIKRLTDTGKMTARQAADWVDEHGPNYVPANGAAYPKSMNNGQSPYAM